jgi:3-phenylpropionate/trans-cinnamate dioxygenase ferredoxin reductase subunit
MAAPGMVILGAGQAGATAALSFRERGWGGAITLIGDEPDPPYERPPLSKAWLDLSTPPTPAVIATPDRWNAAGVDLQLGRRVAAIDRAASLVVFDDGSALAYHRLLLATGATARRLPGVEGWVLRDRRDADGIRAALATGDPVTVVGGGLIGLEIAAAARLADCPVTVVEAAERVLMRAVPAAIADRLTDRHRAEGVDLRLGTREIPDGGTRIIGIGAVPDTELAAAAGLAVDDGILVDARLATSDPLIFAAGDCCRFPHPRFGMIRPESWRTALDQGAHAAGAMLGDPAPYTALPWFWSDHYDIQIQVAGLASAAVETVLRPLSETALLAFGLDATGALVSTSGIGRMAEIAREVRGSQRGIELGARPSPAQLADASVPLRSLWIAP